MSYNSMLIWMADVRCLSKIILKNLCFLQVYDEGQLFLDHGVYVSSQVEYQNVVNMDFGEIKFENNILPIDVLSMIRVTVS